MKQTLSLALLAALSLVSASSCGSSAGNTTIANSGPAGDSAKTSTKPVPKADISAKAVDLAKEYDADGKSVQKYSGKNVEISGKFARSAGTAEAPEVKFDTAGGASVTCVLDPSAYQTAAKFQAGQEIKLVGVGDPVTIIGPKFKNCQVVP